MLRKVLVSAVLVAVLIASGFNATTTHAAGSKTITAIAAGDSRFTTLVAALKAAKLDGVLDGAGPFTVFAPTNAAFDALPKGTVAALLNNIPVLTSILTYHVVAGRVPASTVVTLNKATTVQGSDVLIAVKGGKVILNGYVNVIITDIQASNGIIHVIDAVLIPPVGGLNQLVLIKADSPVLTLPGGDTTGLSLATCKTVFITDILGNFGKVRDIGGWINLKNAVTVASTYGQPGGQSVAAGCVGK